MFLFNSLITIALGWSVTVAAAPMQVIPVGRGPSDVAAVDLDGDGHIDPIVANGEDGTLSLLRGDGDGGFRPFPSATIAAGHAPEALAVGDLNGDGLADAVVLGWTGAYATVIFGDREHPRRAIVPAGRNPWGLEVADLNGDGRDDIAVASHAEGKLAIFVSP